jgi:hypothetical protein
MREKSLPSELRVGTVGNSNCWLKEVRISRIVA